MYSNGAGRVGCSDSVCERVVGRVSGMEKAKKTGGMLEKILRNEHFDEELTIIQEWWDTYRSLLGTETE